ncbi:tyrosine-type recombinase/integrase [Campylobacter sp. RM6883]|uniref:tyrosine-type recombinase/integrase n=1 Tax=Campylobacter californiensis TaxID=1032243 RepID=UPI001451E5C5|nr:tyrosine-type recombinase/integrase [Campylobacter sp. RM6914]MBE2985497.1 tyrosine-type recombinase/integrase [Campylobacter sp. RM6883]MBE2996032.1 tyrosine-type recombinase/integrase [Campylobacter sp. RM6913]QCD51346.1 site-specific recombinase, phage integrase family [Campylobacter sp. RM6914]
MITQFQNYLKNQNLSENTISSYVCTLKQYLVKFDGFSVRNLKAYKLWLIENYRPKTVNLRLRAINCYLESIKRRGFRLKFVKVQQKSFLENVISEADYEYFKGALLTNNEQKWYFVIRFLAATGARVSELVKFKAEHVKLGYLDLYSKGGKLRRIYILTSLQSATLSWLEAYKIKSGFIFLNRFNKPITPRGIAGELKKFAKIYGLDEKVVYPHSFRHLFAKRFLAKFNDIAFLADLMGHENIETTRIYLRKTATEQRQIVDSVIDW